MAVSRPKSGPVDRTPYAAVTEVWSGDAALAYRPMARHLIARAPVPLQGCLALDAGSGSGVAASVLRARGARVVATDLDPGMASMARLEGPAVAADVRVLPFRAGVFGLSVAAFVINHLPDPVRGLAELRRVTRPGGAVLVSAFSTVRAAAKTAVDSVAGVYGFRPPDWYEALQRYANQVGTTAAMEGAVVAAGFRNVEVSDDAVDVGLTDPALVVRYRLALPQLRIFADGLGSRRRAAFLADATAAVAATGEAFCPTVVEAVALV